eukprot:1761143-Pleurochrysis_carterae.AAC.2
MPCTPLEQKLCQTAHHANDTKDQSSLLWDGTWPRRVSHQGRTVQVSTASLTRYSMASRLPTRVRHANGGSPFLAAKDVWEVSCGAPLWSSGVVRRRVGCLRAGGGSCRSVTGANSGECDSQARSRRARTRARRCVQMETAQRGGGGSSEHVSARAARGVCSSRGSHAREVGLCKERAHAGASQTRQRAQLWVHLERHRCADRACPSLTRRSASAGQTAQQESRGRGWENEDSLKPPCGASVCTTRSTLQHAVETSQAMAKQSSAPAQCTQT